MKRLLIFVIFIILQIAAALTAGYTALGFTVQSDAAGGSISYPRLSFSGINASEAIQTVESVVDNQIKNGWAGFIFQDSEYIFNYSDIGLKADYSGIDTGLRARNQPYFTYNLLTAFTRNYGEAPGPIYTADSGKLRQILAQIKAEIDNEPVNADISCTADGSIEIKHSLNGVVLNIDDNFEYISGVFLSNPFKPLALDSETIYSASALSIEEPRVTYDLLAGVDTPLANINVPIPAGLDADAVGRAAEAINKIWLPAKGMAYAPFSFLRYIGEAGLSMEDSPREFSFVATVLMHSLLVGGEDYSKMELVRAQDTDTYPELPGFGLDLSGDRDFTFTNSLDNNIVIFAYTGDGWARVIIAGNSILAGRGAAPYDIRSEPDGNGQMILFRNGKKIG